jgi:hypothetical protein
MLMLFRAPYQQTEDGVNLSIPDTPAALAVRIYINIDNYDGADSDGEIGPFFDAVVDEVDLDSKMMLSLLQKKNHNCKHNLECNINCLQQSKR